MNKENHDGYIRLSCALKRVLGHYKSLIIVVLLFAYLFDIFKTVTYTPVYQSNVSCYFTVNGQNSYSALESTVKYMESMNYIFNSDMVKAGIAEYVDLTQTTAVCNVASVNGTNYSSISVTADSKREAYYGLQYILKWYEDNKTKFKFSYDITELDQANISTSAINPNNHKKNLIIGGVVAGVLYTAILFMFAYFSNTIKCANDITNKLSARLFARLPKESKWISPFRKKKAVLVSDLRTSFAYKEAVKKLRTRVEESSEKHGYKTILVTGSLENEGKSSVSTNLALSLVENNKRVLLVDCDLRQPSIHKLLEADNDKYNINQYLHHEESLPAIIRAYEGAKLDVIYAKQESLLAETLISSEKFKQLVKDLKNSKDYDYIILDTPPARFLPDTTIMNEYVDGCLLTVRQDLANVREINETIDLLTGVKENLIGCVYNASIKDFFTSNKMYGYRYGYSRYGSRGGSK